MGAVAKLDGGFAVRRCRSGEHAIARAGLCEAGDEMPGFAVDGDRHNGGLRPSGPHQQARHAGIVSHGRSSLTGRATRKKQARGGMGCSPGHLTKAKPLSGAGTLIGPCEAVQASRP